MMDENSRARPATIWFMAVAVAMIVANVYYAQPLLADIGRAFALSPTQAGGIVMLTQIGGALAMGLFVPLGDTRERRALIITLVLALSVALGAMTFASNVLGLCLASFAIGMASSTVHLIVPFAAHLAAPHQRGRVVGLVLAGLLMGILLARTFSGFVGEHFGWRAVYGCATVLMLVVAVLVRLLLPRSTPTVALTYPALVRSIFRLVVEQPALRESSLLGAAAFCAFSAFWTTLVFLLESPPFHLGSAAAGMFGLVGAAGAGMAPLIGRLTDRYGARVTIGMAIGLTLASFVVLGLSRHNLIGLIVGVILMDLGVQAGHVGNQTRIYGLIPEARSRLNTVYMTCYFAGGSMGSLLGAYFWRIAGWWGVCGFAIAVLSGAMILFLVGSNRVKAALPATANS